MAATNYSMTNAANSRTVVWHREPNGDQSAMLQGVRLVVMEAAGFARFLLLRRLGNDEKEILLEFGSEDNVGTAMEKAVLRAEARVSCHRPT